jgi:hypothetical protein
VRVDHYTALCIMAFCVGIQTTRTRPLSLSYVTCSKHVLDDHLRRGDYHWGRHSQSRGDTTLNPNQALFWKPLRAERKRTEPSGRGFVLMLVNPGYRLRPQVLSRVILAIGRCIRIGI